MSRAVGQQVACTVTSEARGRIPGEGVELAFGYWPGRGLPVVALHGLTASYVNFIGVAERLAGRRPLLALDLRGRGDSQKPVGPYGMAQHARDVAAAMRALHLGVRVERMLLLIEQVLLGDTERGYPRGVASVVPVGKLDKLLQRSTIISANNGSSTH